MLRRCVSCGEIIPLDEHSHECVGCGATLCNYCAIASPRCPACTPGAPYPGATAQDAVIGVAQVRVTGEDSQHGVEVTLGPWQQVYTGGDSLPPDLHSNGTTLLPENQR